MHKTYKLTEIYSVLYYHYSLFLQTQESGILIDSISCNSHYTPTYPHTHTFYLCMYSGCGCIYNCMYSILQYVPDLRKITFWLVIDESQIPHFQFDVWKDFPKNSFWVHIFQVFFHSYELHSSGARCDVISGPASSFHQWTGMWVVGILVGAISVPAWLE